MKSVQEEDVAVAGKSRRILAFDLIRGFFLLVIMIDHVELYPNGWNIFTGEGRMWVSAAEGFFFLSGLLIGMIYKRRLALGMKFIFTKMWKRALELYVTGTALTFIFLTWVEFSHHSPIKDTLPSPFPWHHYIAEALMMRFTYGWADFLVRFAILMLIAPFVFFLVARGKWWIALMLSLIAWHFRGVGFTLSWQLIFNGGIIIGFYWQQIINWFNSLKTGSRRLIKRGFATATAVSFLASYSSVFLLTWLNNHYETLTPWLRHFTFTFNNYNADIWVYAQKWTMGPLRVVLFFIWFPTLYWFTRKYENQINRLSKGVLELLGRNSLFVYSVHAFIVFGFKMYVIPPITNFWENLIITTLGLALLVAITEAYRRARDRYLLAVEKV